MGGIGPPSLAAEAPHVPHVAHTDPEVLLAEGEGVAGGVAVPGFEIDDAGLGVWCVGLGVTLIFLIFAEGDEYWIPAFLLTTSCPGVC